MLLVVVVVVPKIDGKVEDGLDVWLAKDRDDEDDKEVVVDDIDEEATDT